MKGIKIKTDKKEILVLDVPENAKNIIVRQNDHQSDAWYDIDDVSQIVNLPNGKWQYIGSPSKVTEKQWRGIVDYPVYWSTLTKQYEGNATESGLSLLKSHGVILENPYQKPSRQKTFTGGVLGDVKGSMSVYRMLYDKWKQAQEQVWSNPQIFIKL